MSEDELDPSRAARLYSVARTLTGALTAADVVSAVFTHVQQIGAGSTGLWLVEGESIRFVAGAGEMSRVPRSVELLPLSSALPAAEAIRSGRIVTYGSAEERDQQWPELAGVGTLPGATAVLPLMASGRNLGCLHVVYPGPIGAEGFDMPFLAGLGELCGAALDRAQLHDSIQERQAFLLDVSAAVANTSGFSEALQRLAEAAVPWLADLCLIDVSEEGRAIRRMAAVHADPAKADLVAELLERYPPDPAGRHPASEAIHEGRSLWRPDMPDDYLRETTRDEHHYELVRRLEFTSFISVPLIVAGETLGAITLVSAGSGRRFAEGDLALAEDLAYRVADVVAAARRHEREHEVAHVLQGLLLPNGLPKVDGLEMCARYLTAMSEAEAGGDFYDAVVLPSGRVGVVIGDVEGHDAVAAAIMGQLRSAIRALAGQVREPHLLIDALRWSWDLLGFERMATCLVGRLDPVDGTLVACAAGQPPPLLLDSRGHARVLDIPGSPPLGAPAGPAEPTIHVLEPGATLFLYTDGLVEGRREGIDAATRELLDLLEATGEVPPDELCEQVLAGRPGGHGRTDDIAVLVIRRTGNGPGAELDLPYEMSAVGTARGWLRSQLADWSEEGRSAAVLVASELVANVVLHARTESVLTVHRQGPSCRISVADREPRLPTLKQYSEDAPTGRGLRLVGMLSLDWGIETRPDGKAVWAEVTDAAWPPPGARAEGSTERSHVPTGAPAPTNGYEVRLLGAPVSVLRETQEHHDEVVRELAFVAGSQHISARMQELAADVEEHFGAASEGLRAEIGNAAAGGAPTVDLHVSLSRAGWDALQNLIELLDEVDDHCERMELLTLASSPAVRRLRHWYASEVNRQMAGEPPIPWAEFEEP